MDTVIHFFGLAPLLERFPRAKAVAIPSVVDAMKARSRCPHHSTASGASFFRAEILDRQLSASLTFGAKRTRGDSPQEPALSRMTRLGMRRCAN